MENLQKTNQNAPRKQPPAPLPDTSSHLRNNPQAQKTLAEVLAQCFDTQNGYGKQPEQLENSTKLFLMVLADYEESQIIQAFKLFLGRATTMPTPADIAKIIRRGGRPPLESAVYVTLCQKRERTTEKFSYGTYNGLTEDEKEYISDYEKDAIGQKP